MKSAVILAGGESRRMGHNKALLDFGGEKLIQRVHRILKSAFDEVLISARTPEAYEFLGAPIVLDVYEGGGSLAGIHAGLVRSTSQSCFFTACDMPFLNIELIRYLDGFASEYDLVIPMSRNGLEPLHAFYSKSCLPLIEEQLQEGNLKVIDFFDRISVREVTVEEMLEYDPHELSHFNINTREKYEFAVAKLEEMGVG